MNRKKLNGFTLIEVLMVILLVATLSLMGIQQFNNFSADAKDATLKSNLQVLRRSIATQNAQMRLRCGVTGTVAPPYNSLNGNDITVGPGAQCTTTQVPETDRKFVSGSFPANPWGSAQSTAISTTTDAQSGGPCNGDDDGWCYNENTGEIWANSDNNEGTNEHEF